jgi:hypothetical protein
MSGISPYLCHLGRFEGIHIIGTENPIDSVSGNYVQCLFKDVYCWNASLNVVASAMVSDTKLIGCEFRRLEQKYNGTSYGMFQAAGECDVSLFDCLFEFSGPSDGSFNVMLANVGASLRFFRCLFGSANEISAGAAYPDRLVRSIEHQQTADNHKTWLPNGVTFDSEASVRHTASGIAWKASIDAAGAAKTSTWTPSRIPIAAVPCAASAQVTVSAWLRRTNAGLNAWLACPGGQIPGVDSDVTDELTAAVGTWEQQTISFTPSAAGVVQIELWMASSGAYSCYVDDMTIAQA